MFKTQFQNFSFQPQFHFLFLDSDWGQNWELSVGTLDQHLSLGNLGGGLHNFTGPLSRNINIFSESPAQAQSIGTLVGGFD